MAESAQDAVFDKILALVGDDGKFQKRFNYIFNVGLSMFSSMVYMNIILALSIPTHWCHVPGRESTNSTLDEWRTLTLPRKLDSSGISSFSSCQMYNISFPTDDHQWDYENWNFSDHNVVECVHGYEYDKTWYESTVVSQENWVCEKVLHQTNTYVFIRIGEVIGTFFFGQLGDTFGRRIIYYMSILVMLGGRVVTIFTSSWYTAFTIAVIVASLASNSIFQCPLIISMEISKPENRAQIAMIQCLGWALGMCLMPLIFWAVRDWQIFLVTTTAPIVLFLFFPKYMIESPRWLATVGKFRQSAETLKRIAKINGKSFEITEKYLKTMLPDQQTTKTYGIISLFSGVRIALNTTLLVSCWCVCNITYFLLVILITQLPGNPFLNFFWQGVVELPSYVIGQYLCNRIGRRLTNCIMYISAAVFCVCACFVVQYTEYSVYTICLTVLAKFCVNITFFAINLQALETYPTCLRQSGISVGMIIANIFGICGPYISYMGTAFDSRYPFIIMCGLFFVATVCSSFLPETLYQKLPDSIEEARMFGANQKFWSIPRRVKNRFETDLRKDDETEELNQTKFAP